MTVHNFNIIAYLQCSRFYSPQPALGTSDTWQSVSQYRPQSCPVSRWVVLVGVSPYACSNSGEM